MKITLNDGTVIQVDKEDEMLVRKRTWGWDGRYIKRKVSGKRNGPNQPRDPAKVFYLHREIMQPRDDLIVDHINGDTKDNRRNNLRICTRAQNNQNVEGYNVYDRRTQRPNTKKPWGVQVTHEYKTVCGGSYATIEEAERAAKALKEKLRGQYSVTKRSPLKEAGDD